MAKKKAKSGKKTVSKVRSVVSKAKKTAAKAKKTVKKAKKTVKKAKTLLGRIAQRSAQLVLDSGLLGEAPKPAAKKRNARTK